MTSHSWRRGSSWLLPFCWRTTLESLFRVSSLPTDQESHKVVNFCAVNGCSSRSDGEKSKSFYRIPKKVYDGCEQKWAQSGTLMEANYDMEIICVSCCTPYPCLTVLIHVLYYSDILFVHFL